VPGNINGKTRRVVPMSGGAEARWVTVWVATLTLLALSSGLTHALHVAQAGPGHDSDLCALCALMSTTKPLLEETGEPPLVGLAVPIVRPLVFAFAPESPKTVEPRKTRAPP